MGQRTAIILQHINKKENMTSTRVFYCGWGIGRIMPSHFMGILNGTLTVRLYGEDHLKELRPMGTADITDEFKDTDLNALDFDKPEEVGRVIDGADNNNGGLFVRITTGDLWKVESVEYAYMLGHEEDGDYKSFCTGEKWMSKWDHYIDKRFKDLYLKTLIYFDAKERFTDEA